MKFFSLLTVTLCATVFCGCSSTLPSKKSELMTGEQTAKTAGDSARAAEESGNTGILVGSSNDFIEKKAEPESRPNPIKKESVEKIATKNGSKVYLDHCSSCHGKDGKAGKIPLNTGTLDEIMTVTREGRSKLGMPAWKTLLSEAELSAVAQYVYAFRNNLKTP